MSDEKNMPSAPPPYSISFPTGNSQSETTPYGFQAPAQQYPQPGYPQPGYPQPGYPQPGYPQPSYPLSDYAQPPQTTQPVSQQTVIVMGGCPTCRVGVLEDSYTCCGICCAICFFPLGIICCLLMKEKKCTSCNASF